jgi:hypothetical protein
MPDKTYKLVHTITEPVQIENQPTEYRRKQETVHNGKTWAEAKELRKTDRDLTIVQE